MSAKEAIEEFLNQQAVSTPQNGIIYGVLRVDNSTSNKKPPNFGGFSYCDYLLTIASVSMAIISSSFVGRTYTLTLESGAEISTMSD